MSLKDVAQLVVGLGSGIEKNKVTKDEMKNEGRFGTNPEWTNKIYWIYGFIVNQYHRNKCKYINMDLYIAPRIQIMIQISSDLQMSMKK